MSALAWAAENWRLLVFLAVLGALGVQSYRLQGTQATLKLERSEAEAQEKERQTEAARHKAFDTWNKRKTDEQYARDVAAAHSAGLRLGTDTTTAFLPPAPAGSDQSAVCVGRRELNEELSGWAGREHGRFEALYRKGLLVLASFRACKTWADGLGALDGGGQTPPGGTDAPHGTGTGVVGALPGLPR